MSFSFQKTYELKQQTPLIHFQYDQQGATLRATEVKPKLDRYLISRYKAEHPNEEIPLNWWINPDKDKTNEVTVKALNYRLTINTKSNAIPQVSQQQKYAIAAYNDKLNGSDSKDNQNRARNEICGQYFGNMVSEKENGRDLSLEEYTEAVKKSYKETVFYDEKITLTIVCRIPILLQFLDNAIESFFALYNFGTRQSKGFGGFLIDAKNDNPNWMPTDPLKIWQSCNIPFFYFESNQNKSIKMNMAGAIYAIMKGGVNQSRRRQDAYVKGYIQRQFLVDLGKEGTGSEKAKIKAEVLMPDQKEKCNEYLFVRALLGLPDHYEFRDPFGSEPRRINVYSLGENSFDVERFHSPVTIKVTDRYVAFWFGSVDILDKKFYLYAGTPRGRNYAEKAENIRIGGKAIATPSEINWYAFIRNFIAYFEKEQRKTNSGLALCNGPFDSVRRIILKEGGKTNERK